jgi:hypothetical protein
MESGALLGGIFLGEITNPFFNLIEVLEGNEVNKTISNAVGIIFLFSFIIVRFFIYPYLAYFCFLSPMNAWFKVTIALIGILSYIWCWMMLNKASKLLCEAFPENNCLKCFYNFIKKMRPC